MWLDNLKELKKEKGLSTKQLAERSNLPEKTVQRVLSDRLKRLNGTLAISSTPGKGAKATVTLPIPKT